MFVKNFVNNSKALDPYPSLNAAGWVAIQTILAPNTLKILLFKNYSESVQGTRSPDGLRPLPLLFDTV